jgi:DNA-binding FrmR family transcriptional regulator
LKALSRTIAEDDDCRTIRDKIAALVAEEISIL